MSSRTVKTASHVHYYKSKGTGIKNVLIESYYVLSCYYILIAPFMLAHYPIDDICLPIIENIYILIIVLLCLFMYLYFLFS